MTDLIDLLDGFRELPTPIVGDCMARLVGTFRLRPVHRSKRICGVARTVRAASGDNLFVHHALNNCIPGEVIVVEGGGYLHRALVGELMMLFAQSRGAAGFVIDGAIRDAAVFQEADFPCFAAGQTLRGPYKNGPGAVQVPVTIDGMIVHPGDIVLGDEDGVIAIDPVQAPLLDAARSVLKAEEETKRRIADGTSDRSWVEKRIAELEIQRQRAAASASTAQ